MDQQPLDLPSMSITFPGPFEHHDVVVNGWRVPLLQAHMQGEDTIMLVLDRRIAGEFTIHEAERVIPFVADAVAVALGYGRHPRDSIEDLCIESPNRPRRVSEMISAVDRDLTERTSAD